MESVRLGFPKLKQPSCTSACTVLHLLLELVLVLVPVLVLVLILVLFFNLALGQYYSFLLLLYMYMNMLQFHATPAPFLKIYLKMCFYRYWSVLGSCSCTALRFPVTRATIILDVAQV